MGGYTSFVSFYLITAEQGNGYNTFRLFCATSFTSLSVALLVMICLMGAMARTSLFSASRLISTTWTIGSVWMPSEFTSESRTMGMSANLAREYNAASLTLEFLSRFSVLKRTLIT